MITKTEILAMKNKCLEEAHYYSELEFTILQNKYEDIAKIFDRILNEGIEEEKSNEEVQDIPDEKLQ